MATFQEQAILSVVDKSSKPIAAVNRALKELFKTARSLKSIKVDIKVNAGGLSKATADAKALTAALRSLHSIRAKLNVQTSGIAAATKQVAALRAQAAKPIVVAVRPGPTGPRVAQRQPAQPWGPVAPLAPRTRTATAPVIHAATAHITARSLAATIAGSYVAHAAASAVVRSAKEGTRTVDIGETSLALKEIPAGEKRKYVDDLIRDIGREQAGRAGGGMWNLGHIQQQYSEMAGVVKLGAARNEQDFQQRADAAKYLADQNLELAATFVKLGMSQDQAQETSVKFGKAMEQQGKIFDASGKLNVAAAAAEYNNIRKLIPAIGKEATGENYLALMKYLRVAKFSLEPEAIASAMFKFEEMGTGAAVGINQLIKNLQGSAKPSALAEQLRLGLISGREVTTGKVGRQKTKMLAGEMSEADSDLLRRSPQTWVNERLIPKLREDLKRQGKTEAQIETMLNDAQESGYVARQTQKIASDRTAQEMLASMILLRNENAEALRDFRSRSGTMESQRAATALSVVGATAAISSQFQGVFGEAARAVAPVLVPALGAVSEGLRSVGETVRQAAAGDKTAQEKINKGLVTTALAAPLAAITAGPIAAALGTITAPLGMAAGLSGAVTARDDTSRSLALAGTSLNAAATSLQGAAVAQLAAAGAAPGLIQKLLPFLGVAGGALGVAGGLVLAEKTGALKSFADTAEYKSGESIIKRAEAQLAESRANLARREATPHRDPGEQQYQIAEFNRQIAAANAELARGREIITRLTGAAAEPGFNLWDWLKKQREAATTPVTPTGAPKVDTNKVDLKTGKLLIPGKPENWLYPQPVIPKDQLLHGKFPTGDPKSLYPRQIWSSDDEAKPTKPLADLATPAATMLTAGNLISDAPSRFATVFGTVPEKIADGGTRAGTTIADSLAGRAGGIGSAIGDAFLAKANSAQVTLNIPNQGGAKPVNTGSQDGPT